MKINVKKAKISLEKLASMYADALGLSNTELIELAKKKAVEKRIPEDEALYEVVREKGKMSATIAPLRAWVPQSRAGEAGGIALATLAAVIDENGVVDVRTVKAYPDDEDSAKSVENVKVGIVGKPSTVWKMTGRESAEIKDETGKGIIGVKNFNIVEDDSEYKKDSVAEEISTIYKKMFGITGEALENFNSSVKAKRADKKAKKSYFDAVVETIASFEEASIMIMSDLRIPRKREEGPELKPRMDAIAFLGMRGTTKACEIALYYDSQDEVLEAKSRMTPPIVGKSNNVFALRTVDAETQESIPMIDALGNNKMGIRGFIIDKQGEDVVAEYNDDYLDVLDMCDKKAKGFLAPVERGAGQKVEFYTPALAPFAMINGVASTVDDATKSATLKLIITDGVRTILASMYGSAALAVVGADSPESFKDAVSRVHGGVMKNVRFFGARTHRIDDKTGKDIYYITMSAIHSYEEPTEEETDKIFGVAEKE